MVKRKCSQIPSHLGRYPEYIKKVLRAWVDFFREDKWSIAGEAGNIRKLLDGAVHDKSGKACSEPA